MEPTIRVRGVTRTFGEGANLLRALDGVALDVHRGEVVLLMGPSGSGKTTLLSILGCILRPSEGSVRIAGREVATLSERALPHVRRRYVGFVFQGFNLFPTLTAGENVALALDVHGVRGREGRRRARERLEEVGIADKYRSYPADLSGGQKQRVAIARALAGDPAIILADEPTAALDSHSGQVVMELLHDLARHRGRTVVVVTHDSRILPYADRIVRIEDGRVVDAGLPDRPDPLRPLPAAPVRTMPEVVVSGGWDTPGGPRWS